MTSSRPLDGIRVLDLSRLLPGPFLTMVLGDLGADVVKVEDPRVGDYMRAFPPAKGGLSGRFLAVNRNKRSLALDLKTPAGTSALLRLVERADVVVESFRPGVMDRLGVGFSVLQARNPKVVLCSISGYGATGPYVEKAGHDLNYIALAGVLGMGAEARERKPAMPGVQIADFAGGALWSATSILAALVGRDRTGQGAHLDISMTEGAMALLIAELGNLDCGQSSKRGTGMLNGALAAYSVYRTKDGKYLSVGALEPKFWLAFNAGIGRPGNVAELIAPPDKQDAIRAEIQTILDGKTRDEWVAHLAGFDCCCEPVLELDEVAAHPLHVAREAFFTLDGGDLGPMQQLRTPVGVRDHSTPAPRLGQHSRDVLADYGFAPDEIAALVEKP